VRLTRFVEGRLTGQWAYVTEPTAGELPYLNVSRSGLVDLAALPDGRLLALERATYGRRSALDPGGFVSRIFLLALEDATDVADRARLAGLTPGRDYRPVGKTLLWRRDSGLFDGLQNFEGLALGPVLGDGRRSLLLVSDNDRLPSALLALTVDLSGASPAAVRQAPE
jgi:hypothetical protein